MYERLIKTSSRRANPGNVINKTTEKRSLDPYALYRNDGDCTCVSLDEGRVVSLLVLLRQRTFISTLESLGRN